MHSRALSTFLLLTCTLSALLPAALPVELVFYNDPACTDVGLSLTWSPALPLSSPYVVCLEVGSYDNSAEAPTSLGIELLPSGRYELVMVSWGDYSTNYDCNNNVPISSGICNDCSNSEDGSFSGVCSPYQLTVAGAPTTYLYSNFDYDSLGMGSPAPTTTPTSPPSPQPQSSPSSHTTAIIVGCAVGGSVVLVVALLTLALLCYRRSNQHKQQGGGAASSSTELSSALPSTPTSVASPAFKIAIPEEVKSDPYRELHVAAASCSLSSSNSAAQPPPPYYDTRTVPRRVSAAEGAKSC